MNREYYYIPLHPVVDAIKYKVSKLTSTIKAQYTPSEERKEYICLRCSYEWTELDVLSLIGDEGFECQNCGAVLERTEDVKGADGIDRTGHEKNSKLMAQLDGMLKLLKQIDSVEVPPNDFDTAWDHKIDVVRNQHTNPTRPTVAVPSKQQETVRGNTKTDTTALEISLTSSEEKSAAEQAEETARKAAVERQNALPVWHTHSTVSTGAGNVGPTKTEQDVSIKPEIKDEEDQKPNIDALDDKVAAYYAEMAREQALQAQADASSAEDESDEFDEEFEDVGVSASGSATPAGPSGTAPTSNAPTGAPPSSASSASGVKREFDADTGPESSAPDFSAPTSASQTGAATPSTTAAGEDGPAMKKVKTEPEPEAETEVKKEESDEDEEEFEDV